MNIKLDRVIKDIETLATFTATEGNGVTRLTLTEEDRKARAYIKNQMEEIGMKVWEDGYSTLFGRMEGENPDAPVIMIGSHYDSVINGGPFDGVVGIVVALEVLRVMKENNIKSYYPIEIAAMNDEEGVRFGRGVSNSRAMAGLIDEEELDSFKDRDGISLREAIEQFGIAPDLKGARRPDNSIKAYIEVHVEQGPILEDNKMDIGLVEGIIGMDRYDVTIKGKSGHAGTTPMNNRKDALVAASEFVLDVNRIAKEVGGGTVGTVGELDVLPNASNVIPGCVKLSVDIRSIEEDNINKVVEGLKETIVRLNTENNVEVKMERKLYAPPVKMSKGMMDIIEDKAKKIGYKYMKMNSGAGHDAMIMANLAPSSLIFVPSKDGLSHHPDEWTDYEYLEKSINLVLETIVDTGTGQTSTLE